MTLPPRPRAAPCLQALAYAACFVLVGMGLPACSTPSGHTHLLRTRPEFVTVQLTEALICPWDSNGKEWDRDRTVSRQDMDELDEALASADPFAASAAFITGLTHKGFSPPDPYGQAELWSNGSWNPLPLATKATNLEDTFRPLWRGAPGWQHVRFEPTLRIRVTLYDEDILNDDPIGVVELDANDILAALDFGQQFPVRVYDRGQQQVLFIGLSVTAE
jgi:hypothetical protein